MVIIVIVIIIVIIIIIVIRVIVVIRVIIVIIIVKRLFNCNMSNESNYYVKNSNKSNNSYCNKI